MRALRVRGAANPGPRRKKPPPTAAGLRAWRCNANGLQDKQGKKKWDTVRGQLDAARAHVACIVDSNLDELSAQNFGKLVYAMFPSCLFSVPAPPDGCWGGVVLFGPAELRKDPWLWSSEFAGRVVSVCCASIALT